MAHFEKMTEKTGTCAFCTSHATENLYNSINLTETIEEFESS